MTLIAATIDVNSIRIIAALTSTALLSPQACITVISLSVYSLPSVIKIARNRLRGRISCAISGTPSPNSVRTRFVGTSPSTAAPKILTNFWQKKINNRINRIASWLLSVSRTRYLIMITLNTPVKTCLFAGKSLISTLISHFSS